MMSMTGYGTGAALAEGRECTVEIKSVNHRFLDISVRAPRQLASLEDGWRKQIGSRVSRGHLDVYVSYRNTRGDSRQVIVDEQLARAYAQAFTRVEEIVREQWDRAGQPSVCQLAQMPEVLRVDSAPEDKDAVASLCEAAMSEALDSLAAMRALEGAALRRDLSERLDVLEGLRLDIAALAPTITADYREKLNQRIREAIDAYPDPTRLATEVALIADRSAIDEELARLESHIVQMRGMLAPGQPTGRKLDFLIQEMNREANTIGSKSMSADITRLVVDAKGEIEKLREQIQNVE